MIELRNVTKQFDDHVIFDNFSLEIPDGTFLVIAGKSGCGKTTLINMIGGLEQPDQGEILVNGKNLKSGRVMKDFFTYQVGFLFQNFALIEEDTVLQNLQLVQKKARTQHTPEEILAQVGLGDKGSAKVYQLSGGEQQRVALARLMYKQCDIILADEPTGSLDEENGAVVMQLLHELHDQGKTIIVVTHNKQIIDSELNVLYLHREKM